MTITTYTDREIKLQKELALEKQLAKLNGEIAAELKAESDTIRHQLAEAQALIEASRKQKPVAYEEFAIKYANGTQLTYDVRPNIPSYVAVRPLYAAPVVADDVLKELLWIRTFFAKAPANGGVVIKNIKGQEVSKWIDCADSLGGANE